MTFRTLTLEIVTLSVIYAECHYAEWRDAAIFYHQVASWVLNVFLQLLLVKNHKIDEAKAIEKISTGL